MRANCPANVRRGGYGVHRTPRTWQADGHSCPDDPKEFTIPSASIEAFVQFARDQVPRLLVDVIGVEPGLAEDVGADVYARGCAVALLTEQEKTRLSMPFFEETFFYEPDDAGGHLKALVALAVRNSALEPLHSDGPLESGGIQFITRLAAGPLSHLLAAARAGCMPQVPDEARELLAAWRGLEQVTPRAWDAFDALAELSESGGGRIGSRRRTSAAPQLEVGGNTRLTEAGAVVLDAMNPRFDPHTAAMLQDAVERRLGVFFVATLSRLSRNLVKLATALEYLLAGGVPVLTTNYLLRPSDVWARRTIVAVAGYYQPTPQLTGLVGAHRHLYVSAREHLAG